MTVSVNHLMRHHKGFRSGRLLFLKKLKALRKYQRKSTAKQHNITAQF